MIRIAAPSDVKSFCYIAALLGVSLQLASCWPSPSNDLPDGKFEDIDLTSKRHWSNNLNSWGKRSWQNLQGGWGKRSNDYQEDKHNPRKLQEPGTWQRNDEQIDSHIPIGEIVSFLQKDMRLDRDNDDDFADQDNELTLKEKRGWNRLPTWGKRARGSNIASSWGNKKDPAWTNLKGIWGKRNGNYPDEPNL